MPDSNKSPWRLSKRKLSNIKVVVLCIAAATTFWVLNALNKDNYSTIVDYPVQWEFDQKNYVPVKPLPKSIQIQVSGNGWDLLRKYFNISSTAYPILIPSPAEKNFLLTADLKRGLGEFITPTLLENVLGDTIHYQIDRIVTKTLIPELDSAGYSLDKNSLLEGKVSFYPDKLEVTGPTSILESYQGKFPVVLNAKKISKNFSAKVPLALEDDLTTLVQLKQSEIQVSFSVVTYLEGNKRLKIKKINFPAKVSLADEELIPVLSYLIQEADLPNLKDLEFEAILDYRNRNRADSTLQIEVSPKPKFLKEVKITPSQLKLTYE
ncbi:MAG: YbbR-like domain-containing protein [Algoriphagus sp.]|nr:YbbR-like domain-containing protein [Algoriphagus sp.]